MPTVEEYHRDDRKQSGLKAGCTVGRGINVSIAVNFFCILISSLVVVGTVSHLKEEVKDHPDSSTHSHSCILYASHHHDNFYFGSSYACEYAIATFSITAIVAFLFLIVSILRVVMAPDLWYTVIIETAILIVGAVMIFIAGVTISIGMSVTCSAVKDYYDSPEDHCNRKVPDDQGFHYLHEINSSQAGAWFTFMFVSVALLVFIIRVVIFFRRRRRMRTVAEDREVLTHGEREKLTASQTKPV